MAERVPDVDLERSTNRWMTVGAILIVLLVLTFPVYRVYEPVAREESRRILAASLARQGSELFTQTCASCHGAQGEGIDAPALNSVQFLGAANDEQITSLIAHGVPGTAMSAFSLDFGGFLTSEQIAALTVYLRSLAPDAPDRPDWRDPSGTEGHDGEGEDAHDDGEDQEEQVPAGTAPAPDEPGADESADTTFGAVEPPVEPTFDAATAYAALCAVCHGASLEGGVGPALGPTAHSLDEPDAHLVEAIAFGRGEMPAFGVELSNEEIAELVAFIRAVQAGE